MPLIEWFTIVIGCFLPALIYLTYRRLLPHLITGISYNPTAAKYLFGDFLALARTGRPDLSNWILEQCTALDFPIIQMFMRPFRPPWSIITDFQEANDILTRRAREFDRSDFFGVSPKCTVVHAVRIETNGGQFCFCQQRYIVLTSLCAIDRIYLCPCCPRLRVIWQLATSGKRIED